MIKVCKELRARKLNLLKLRMVVTFCHLVREVEDFCEIKHLEEYVAFISISCNTLWFYYKKIELVEFNDIYFPFGSCFSEVLAETKIPSHSSLFELFIVGECTSYTFLVIDTDFLCNTSSYSIVETKKHILFALASRSFVSTVLTVYQCTSVLVSTAIL